MCTFQLKDSAEEQGGGTTVEDETEIVAKKEGVFHLAYIPVHTYVCVLSFSHPHSLDHGKEHPPEHEPHKQLAEGEEEENGKEENTAQADPLAEIDEHIEEANQQQEEVPSTYYLLSICVYLRMYIYMAGKLL